MGNHAVGEAMNIAAKVFWRLTPRDRVPNKALALDILDIAGKSFRGADAEFDDYANPDQPLGKLIAIAFEATPEEIPSSKPDEAALERWYDGPYARFSAYFDFC